MSETLFDPASPMDAQRTIAVYETLRQVNPPYNPCETVRLHSLRNILRDFDALLLDGFGVLNVGKEAVPGAASLIKEAEEAGVAVLVLTNGASRPTSVFGPKYREMGLPIGDEQVVSSREAMLKGMESITGAIGIGGPRAVLPEGDDRFVPLDPSRPEQWLEMRSIAFVGSTDWSPRWQECLGKAVEAGVPVHVANPDVVAPQGKAFSMEPGFWVAAALHDHPGAEMHWYGKPYGPVFDIAMERLETVTGRVDWDTGRVAMVGDTLHTDILGGNAAGLKTVLVTGHGLFRDGGADEAMELTGIRPDIVAATV